MTLSKLIIKQDIETEFFVSDLRKISYLLEKIESINKCILIDLELHESYFNKSQKEKKKIYTENDRVEIQLFLKQSPIEIHLILKNLTLLSELLLMLIENIEDSQINSKIYFERLTNKTLSDNDWYDLIKKIKLIKKIIRIMNFSITLI
jgi:hypothetical protein